MSDRKIKPEEDPKGLIVTWFVGERQMLADVVDSYVAGPFSHERTLVLRHFNGESAGEMQESQVEIV